MNNSIFSPADILLPKGCKPEHWSIVACDQYTSEPEYWSRVQENIGESPSTLRMILPEVYLNDPDVDLRIEKINATMQSYLENDTFLSLPESYLYIQRTLAPNKVREGLIGKIDLLEYDYTAGSESPVRPTEGTVESRLPPRVRVRRNAPLESPHIMLLLDDPKKTVIEPLAALCKKKDAVYAFELMEHGGKISGWQVPESVRKEIDRALSTLMEQITQKNHLLAPEKAPLLFAVGDGNHSLATAKACYDQLKTVLPEAEWLAHPARYALVELVNVHNPALEFEPIHRVVFGVEPEQLLTELRKTFVLSETDGQRFTLLIKGKRLELGIENPSSQLAVGTLQKFIDTFLATHGGTVDYIHGDDVVERLCARPDAVGVLLPAMQKSDLFPTVQLDGSLPRKTFSMGHAWEKRYYLECRKIK